MVWIVLGLIGLAAVLLVFGAVKVERLGQMEDDDGVSLLEDNDADGR